MFKKTTFLAFLLSLTLIACPQPTEVIQPPTPPAPPSPPTVSSKLELSGTITPWTRGARVAKANVYYQSSRTIATGDMNAAGAFAVTVNEPDASVLYSFGAPSSCAGKYTVTPDTLKGVALTQLELETSSKLRSGSLVKGTPGLHSSPLEGEKFVAYLYADQDGVISADCSMNSPSVTQKINLSLKKGWNTAFVEYLPGNVIRFSGDAAPSNVAWQFVPASGLKATITNAPQALETGKNVNLSVSFTEPDGTPASGTPPQLTWTSSDPTVASVDANGKLTTGRLGSTQISGYVANAPATGVSFMLNVYGLEATGGTFNVDDQKLGVATKLRYVDATGKTATQPYSVTLTGPTGWNNGQPLAAQVPLAPSRQGGFSSAFQSLTTDVAAVTGNYSIHVDSAPVSPTAAPSRIQQAGLLLPTQPLQYPRATLNNPIRTQAFDGPTASFTVDAAKKWETVRNIRFSTDYNNNVSVLWDVSQTNVYATAFEVEVYDQTAAVLATPRLSVSYGGAVSLTGVTLDKSHTYQLRVYSFPEDYAPNSITYGASKTTAVQDFRPYVTQTDAAGGVKAGGYTLNLTGQNFDADTRIFFGTNEVTTKTLQNTGQMQVVVPAGTAGTVNITLKDKNNLSSIAAVQSFKYYEAGEYDAKSPTNLLANTDGTMYFIEYDGNTSPIYSLAKINSSGTITRIGLPNIDPGRIQDITLDSSGRVWIAAYNKVVRVNANNSLTEIALPNGVQAAMIAFGSDGNLWIARSDAYKITRIKPDGTAAAEFTLINNGSSTFYSNYEMVLGTDGNLWFTSPSGLGRITTSGAITIFQQQSFENLIISGSSLWGSSYSGLVRVATDGTLTTYPQSCSGKIAAVSSSSFWCTGSSGSGNGIRLSYSTIGAGTSSVTKNVIVGQSVYYTSVSAIAADANGKIWYVNGSKIGVITP